MDTPTHDDSSTATPGARDATIDELNASLSKAVWLAAVEPWSLADCLEIARVAKNARTEEPTVVCALARLSATAFIERVGGDVARPCSRCATEATRRVCATCHVAPTCEFCRVCRGCCEGWLPEEGAQLPTPDQDDGRGGAS